MTNANFDSAGPVAQPKASQAYTKASAFAILPTEKGPVLASPDVVDGMLRADWSLFLELATYALHGGHGPCRIAFGTEEVAESIEQAAAAVLFIPVTCGHGGEAAVRGVAMGGGRGYIVGSSHELFESVEDWGAAALLHYPLIKRPIQSEHAAPDTVTPSASPPPKKKTRVEEEATALAAATAKAASPAPPVVIPVKLDKAPSQPLTAQPVQSGSFRLTEKDLKDDLKGLGSIQSLGDKTSIPKTTESIRNEYLPALGASAVFKVFSDIFQRAAGVAHRKAVLYVVHELFMSKKGSAMRADERRASCLRNFLLRIAELVKAFRTDEREAYLKAASIWQTSRVFLPSELSLLKDAWDMD